MKQLTIDEKFELIRYHGSRMARTNTGLATNYKADVIESTERVIELARSIPKQYWAEEK